MEFDELLRILRNTLLGHLRMIVLLVLAATLGATALSFVIPEKYEATALVLIRPQEPIGLTPKGGADKEMLSLPASGSSMQVETPSKTYIEVIRSRAVTERIVRTLELHRKDQPVENPDLATRIKGGVKAFIHGTKDVLKYGRLIEISPVDRAVRELTRNISLTALRNTFVFEISYLSGDPREASEVANTAARVFVEYNSQANEAEAKGNREFIATQLTKTESKLNVAREGLREFKEAHRTAAFEEERTERIKRIALLATSLSEYEAELSGLLAQYTPANPKVRLLEAKSQSLGDAIAAEQDEIDLFPGQEAQLADLELEVRTLESAYEYLKMQFEETLLRESRKVADIRVVSPATVPTYPVRPIKIYYASVAFFVGLFAAFGVALFLELSDTRLRTVDQVERALGAPVLATVPQTPGGHGIPRDREVRDV